MVVGSVRDTMINLNVQGTVEDIMKVLEAQGMPVKRNLDIDMPPFPKDVTAVNDQELMELATKYMENYNFMLTQVACAELAYTEAENAFKLAESTATLLLTTGKTTEKANMLKAQVMTEPAIRDKSDELFKLQVYHKLLKTTLDNLERYYQLTSRELTRRTSVLKARSY
jgi:hypothetical protein